MTLPVLATNYSGPTELLRPENAYAIGYSGPAADGKVQPHVHELRGAMRRVYTHPAKARAKGQQARRDILAQYDPAAVAATVASRLQRIVADHLGAVPPPQPLLGAPLTPVQTATSTELPAAPTVQSTHVRPQIQPPSPRPTPRPPPPPPPPAPTTTTPPTLSPATGPGKPSQGTQTAILLSNTVSAQSFHTPHRCADEERCCSRCTACSAKGNTTGCIVWMARRIQCSMAGPISAGSISEKDAKLAQKLGQLRPLMAIFSQGCMGQLASFGPT